MWRLGARWGVLGRAAVEQGALEATAMPFLAALGTDLRGKRLSSRARRSGERDHRNLPGRPGPEVVQRGWQAPATACRVQPPAAGPRTGSRADAGARPAPAALHAATRTDAAWIAADLQRIRTRGYLLTTDEVVAGAATVATPVRDASGQVVAVLSVSAPTMRMRPPRPRALLPTVLDTAAKLSRALGANAGDTGTRADSGRKGQGASAGSSHETPDAAPALAASGPHSIFR